MCKFRESSRCQLNVRAMRINRFLPWPVFLMLQLALLPVTRCHTNADGLQPRTIALYRLVNYLAQRPQQINVDGLYGITLAEANLLAALDHPNARFISPQYRRLIAAILQMLDRTRLRTKSNVRPESQDVAMLNAVLNEPSLWIRSIYWREGTIGSRPDPASGLNQSVVEESILRGSPQEKESDSCIGQLVNNEGTMIGQRCKVSDECAEILSREDDPAGYPLTHRLLFAQTVRALGCLENPRAKFVRRIPDYCRETLRNLVDAEFTDFPGVSRDLAIEQVLLCGMEGYLEFANDHYAKLIVSWAHPRGCYNSRGFYQRMKASSPPEIAINARRSSNTMDFGCENHASGLAAGALALLVRESLENAFEPISPYNNDHYHYNNHL